MKRSFVAVTVILIMVITFCATGTVMGMEKDAQSVDEKYYKQMEKEYVTHVRSYLQEAGYENSGVSLTKVIFEDGSRAYTLNVHHKRIESLSISEQQELQDALAGNYWESLQDEFCIAGLLVVFS